eukprot:jgi/Botrbrau1/5238/Bobra.0172s0100.1
MDRHCQLVLFLGTSVLFQGTPIVLAARDFTRMLPIPILHRMSRTLQQVSFACSNDSATVGPDCTLATNFTFMGSSFSSANRIIAQYAPQASPCVKTRNFA